ncbi:MAG: hypothetical protein HYX40_12320 [Sphingobacteriales bacterium]|nr:hypothetical protein [Sphingobacteriales bacterium]
MKIQESLSQYLYDNKKLTLSGIGHFTLDASLNVYEKNDPALIQHAIQFTTDSHAQDDPELIIHLVKTTGKMKPLAISDLESFLTTGKQLLNIGKPFILPGIGSLTQLRNTLQFTPGQLVAPKLDEKIPEHKLRDKTVEEPNFSSVEKEFDYEEGTRKTSRRWLMILATVLILAIAGWGVYYFLFKKPNNAESEQSNISTDTATIKPVPDTTATIRKDTLPTKSLSIPAIPDSVNYTYAIELREYNYLKSAESRIGELRSLGHKVFLEAKDSAHFALLIPINGPLADSSRVIDSLSIMLLKKDAKRPFVRLK